MNLIFIFNISKIQTAESYRFFDSNPEEVWSSNETLNSLTSQVDCLKIENKKNLTITFSPPKKDDVYINKEYHDLNENEKEENSSDKYEDVLQSSRPEQLHEEKTPIFSMSQGEFFFIQNALFFTAPSKRRIFWYSHNFFLKLQKHSLYQVNINVECKYTTTENLPVYMQINKNILQEISNYFKLIAAYYICNLKNIVKNKNYKKKFINIKGNMLIQEKLVSFNVKCFVSFLKIYGKNKNIDSKLEKANKNKIKTYREKIKENMSKIMHI
ncbi:hypothetical protein EHP00_1154 [Ecytonucleospora hepatopenaei]|uniref:Uncharacterized protein n=1 Tax=Ecytonucleospora hepatopenaei TaxID=646526 RepID=A0A1W0E4B4_9MICR|nr:hypothetical protein EHP00_1154 [Ecytonucleospora hepatopenaei]